MKDHREEALECDRLGDPTAFHKIFPREVYEAQMEKVDIAEEIVRQIAPQVPRFRRGRASCFGAISAAAL